MTTAVMNKEIRKGKVGKGVSLGLTYTFLVIMAIFTIIPFYWMLVTALRSADEILYGSTSLFPQHITWSNFPDAFKKIEYFKLFGNTIIVAVFSTIGGTIISILAAFALSRLNFKGKEAIFTFLMATMMIPGEMLTVTNFGTVTNLKWTADSSSGGPGPYLAMIIPFLVSVFHIYQLRQTFRQIPDELYYAAKVDGTSDIKYMRKVMVPMAKSSIVTIIILKVMGAWNSYAWPNLVGGSRVPLMTSGLRRSFTDVMGNTELQLQMAAAVMVVLPLLILFIVFRKYIMRGVSRSGIKG